MFIDVVVQDDILDVALVPGHDELLYVVYGGKLNIVNITTIPFVEVAGASYTVEDPGKSASSVILNAP